MNRLLTLALAMGIAITASAFETATTIRPVGQKTGIDFSKPLPEMPKHGEKAPAMSAARGEACVWTDAASSAMQAPAADGEVINVTGTKFAYVQRFQGDWFMSFFSDPQEDGDYYMFKFDFKNPNPDSPAGHYTSTDDLEMAYSYGHSESQQFDTIRYAAIDMTVIEDEDGALTMDGDMWSTKGQQYHICIEQAAPIKPKEEYNLEIVCDPTDCYLSESESAFAGIDPTTGWFAQVAVRGLTGDFDKDHIMNNYTGVFFSLDPVNGVGIEEQQAVSVTMDEQRLFDVTATFVATDSIRYNIHMTLQLPEGGEPIEVKITNAQTSSFWGYFMTQGYNDEYEAQASGVMKTGQVEDLSTFSAAVAYEQDGTTMVGYSLFMHSATLSTDADNNLVVECSFYGNDYKEYHLDMRYVEGEIVDTITLAFDDCEYINALEKEQAQRIQGDDNSGQYFVQVTMLNTTETAGSFSFDAGDTWGYIHDRTKGRSLSFVSGTVEVTMEEDGYITALVSAEAMDTEMHHFELTLHTQWDTEYLQKREYDAEEGELNAAFGPEDEVTMENHIAEGSYLYFNAYSEARGEVLTLVIYSPKRDKKIFIPEGEYKIDDTDAMYTVQASPGVYDNALYPSYYAEKTPEGYLNVPVWMLERGTMTVTKVDNQLTFVIDAINSYKRPIHITYNCTDDALRNIETENVQQGKRMEQGQMIIYHADKRYNALGTHVKH